MKQLKSRIYLNKLKTFTLAKKITLGIFSFILGIVIAYFSELFFRELIQDIFKWSTSDKIKFVGKNFYVFSNKLYFISFGIGFLILTLQNLKHNLYEIFKSVIMSLSLFGIVLFGISTMDANLKIIECTACEDGIRKLHWNDINYGLIIGISVFIGIIPSLIQIIKRTNKPTYNNV